MTSKQIQFPQVPTVYVSRRTALEIEFDIIDTIFRGTVRKTRLSYKTGLKYTKLQEELVKLEAQGYIVSVTTDFRKGLRKQRGQIRTHYAVTERGNMWRLVMQRAEELAPK